MYRQVLKKGNDFFSLISAILFRVLVHFKNEGCLQEHSHLLEYVLQIPTKTPMLFWGTPVLTTEA